MKNNLQDLASERAVLAALCQYGLDCYLEIDFVDADHFTNDMNQLLYHCIYKSVSENSKVELASILSAANSLGVSESINNKEEMSFIRSLFNFPIHKENAKSHAVKIAKLKLATICAPVVGGLRLPSPRASNVVASTALSHPELINVPLANVLLSDI